MPRKGENIRKRKDGRWEGRYIKEHDISEKAVYGSVYAKTYLDVKRKLIEMNKMVIDKALPGTQQKVVFREVLYLWLENSRIKLKPQTYADYKYMIESHILPIVGSLSISHVNTSYINSFLYNISKNGRLDGKGGLSSNYIRKLSFIIISALDYAAKERFCSPLCGDIILPQNKKYELEVLSIKEQSILEQYIFSEFDERKLGVLISLYAGLRIGEVCGLRWSDIDFETQTIHIRHTVERIRNVDGEFGDSNTKLILGDTKTFSSNRVVPISPKLLGTLKKCVQVQIRIYSKEAYMSIRIQEPTNIVFKGTWNPATCVRSITMRYAIPYTFATRCIESGMDLKSLSETLVNITVDIKNPYEQLKKLKQLGYVC